MKAIVVTEEELQRLEKRLGPGVRHMGPWNSDGTFGYSTVPMVAVEKAAEALEDPDLMAALSRLGHPSHATQPFIELLESFGPDLVEKIVWAYRECPLELTAASKRRRRVSVATAAG
jgi:hypothetical protein